MNFSGFLKIYYKIDNKTYFKKSLYKMSVYKMLIRYILYKPIKLIKKVSILY